MRKLIVITHSLYKNNTQYDKEIYNNACGEIETIEAEKELVA